MAMTNDQGSVAVTREKLIEAAGQVFAEVGFEAATVREICSRAGANVAAVNYHFGDKLGLYTEVLKSSMSAQQAPTKNTNAAHPSDLRAALRALVYEWFKRIYEGGRPAWFARVMAHEMAQPTPALDRVAEAMGPNYLRFRTLVGKLIGRGPNDARTRMCVHSVIGQILHYVQSSSMLARLWPNLELDNEQQRRAIADHIVEFSLAGMKSFTRQKGVGWRVTVPTDISTAAATGCSVRVRSAASSAAGTTRPASARNVGSAAGDTRRTAFANSAASLPANTTRNADARTAGRRGRNAP